MIILEPLSSSWENVSNLRVGLCLNSLDWSNSALSPVVHGHVASSINIYTIYTTYEGSAVACHFRGCKQASSRAKIKYYKIIE